MNGIFKLSWCSSKHGKIDYVYHNWYMLSYPNTAYSTGRDLLWDSSDNNNYKTKGFLIEYLYIG